ncbi:hypothetical protein CHUAL_006852 [Chamberlinius hualienensis]
MGDSEELTDVNVSCDKPSDAELLHNFIINNEVDNVNKLLDSKVKTELDARFYENSKGESVALVALQRRQYEMYAIVLSKGIRLKDTERYIIYDLKVEEKSKLQKALLRHFPQVEDAAIWFLLSKTRFATEPQKSLKTQDVERFYRKLLKIPEISIILSVVKCSDKLDIIFDFDQESVIDIVPTTSVSTLGVTDRFNGKIYIGAKGNEKELLGTIAHELTHYAMQIVYENGAKPYRILDKNSEKEFKKIVNNLNDMRSYNLDNIIEIVFSCYGEDSWPTELIVRVNHMLAYYGETSGTLKLENESFQLLSYYRDYVMKSCESFINQKYFFESKKDIWLLNYSLGLAGIIEQTKIQFKKSENFQKKIQFDDTCLLVLTSKNTFLTSTKVYQTLIDLNRRTNRFLILNFEAYCKQSEEVIKFLYTEFCMLLVVNFDIKYKYRIKELEEFLDSMSQLFNDKAKTNVIVVIDEKTKSEFEEKLKFHCGKYRFVSDEWEFNSLTDSCQKDILSKEVNFQGKFVGLGKLINNQTGILDANTLERIISKPCVSIGSDITESRSYDRKTYIPRNFKYTKAVSNDVFNNFSIFENDIIAISSVTKGDLEQMVQQNISISSFDRFGLSKDSKFVVLDDNLAADQFNQLSTTYNNYNIHWLENSSKGWMWNRTHGSLKNLRQYMDANMAETLDEKSLISQVKNQSVVIISAEAGSGKSTILTSLAFEIKCQANDIWIVRVNLNDCTQQFKNMLKNRNYSFTDEDANEFLFSTQIHQTKTTDELDFDRKLFNSMSDKTIVILDGFDEIDPDYSEIVTNLVKTILKSKIKQVWLTSRSHCKAAVENSFQCFSFEICPLSDQDEIDFLLKIWEENLGIDMGDFKNRLISFAKELQQNVINMIAKGNPLHIKMVAELYSDHCRRIVRVEPEQNTPKIITLIDLYEHFLRKKFDLQSNKDNIDSSKIQNSKMCDQEYKCYIEKHQRAALSPSLFFNKSKCKTLLTWAYGSENEFDLTRIEAHGIVVSCANNQVEFIHRTFAEYLIAKFLSAKMLSLKMTSAVFKIFIQILSEVNYFGVYIFFSKMVYLEKPSSEVFITFKKKISLSRIA